MDQIFALLSAGTVLLGGPAYFTDTLKGKTKPERTTWLIWSVLGVVAFISQFDLHARWSLVVSGMDAIGNIGVFLLSLKYGVGGWKRKDLAALCIAAVGVTIAILAKDPLFALFGVIIA